MFDAHAQKNILIVMLHIFDNLFHYKNIVTVKWIKCLKLCMVTMATLPPAKELKIHVVSWQNEIRTLDVLKSPTCRPTGVQLKRKAKLPTVIGLTTKHAVCCKTLMIYTADNLSNAKPAVQQRHPGD